MPNFEYQTCPLYKEGPSKCCGALHDLHRQKGLNEVLTVTQTDGFKKEVQIYSLNDPEQIPPYEIPEDLSRIEGTDLYIVTKTTPQELNLTRDNGLIGGRWFSRKLESAQLQDLKLSELTLESRKDVMSIHPGGVATDWFNHCPFNDA